MLTRRDIQELSLPLCALLWLELSQNALRNLGLGHYLSYVITSDYVHYCVWTEHTSYPPPTTPPPPDPATIGTVTNRILHIISVTGLAKSASQCITLRPNAKEAIKGSNVWVVFAGGGGAWGIVPFIIHLGTWRQMVSFTIRPPLPPDKTSQY
jgi:hypothetical protein